MHVRVALFIDVYEIRVRERHIPCGIFSVCRLIHLPNSGFDERDIRRASPRVRGRWEAKEDESASDDAKELAARGGVEEMGHSKVLPVCRQGERRNRRP